MEETFLTLDEKQSVAKDDYVSKFTSVGFEGVVNFLKQTIPIGTIYNLSNNTKALDLVIVLEKSCGKALSDFEDVIDIAMLGYDNSVCTLHTFGGLNKLLLEGNLFYNWVCVERNVIYRKNNAEQLPYVSEQVYMLKNTYFNRLFKIEMIKACSFLDGATYFMDLSRFELAVFMLQQAVELTYRCFLNLMRGKDIKCHELYVLRRNIKRFAPQLLGAFSDNEEEELHYLSVLGKSYCDARYNRDYKIRKEEVILLHQKVKELHSRSFDLFAGIMVKLDNLVGKSG